MEREVSLLIFKVKGHISRSLDGYLGNFMWFKSNCWFELKIYMSGVCCYIQCCSCFCLGLTSLWNIWSHITMLVAVVLWPMCCHTEMPCCRHRTWHLALSQYTDMGLTCRCAIHWCGTPHWNTQLPTSMSTVRPDREILPRPSTHTSEPSTWCCHGGLQSEAQLKVPYQPGARFTKVRMNEFCSTNLLSVC